MSENNSKKKKRKSGIGIRIYAFVALIFALLIGACIFLLLFRVQNVDITGATRNEEEDVREWVMKDAFFDNAVFALLNSKGEQNGLPVQVESVSVSMTSPWSLKVKVQEKGSVGCFEQLGEYVYFDAQGYVLEKTDELYDDVILVTGFEENTAETGKQIDVEYPEVFASIAEAEDYMSQLELSPAEIQVEENNLFLRFDNVRVAIGNEEYQDRIAQLPEILKELQGESGTLHLENFTSSSKNVWFQKS